MHLRLQHIAKWAFGALMLAFAGGAHAEGGKPWTSVQTNPLVIELFTSQGCSSCPPADIVLDQIADIPGVLGLAFHVDYWDYIGWKDPFATSVSTKRQKYYRHVLGNRYIYTPQFVIGGNASPDPSSGSLIDRDSIRAPKTQIMLKVTDAGILMPLTGDLPNAADIWVVHFDERHETEITKGENAGRELGLSPRGSGNSVPWGLARSGATGCVARKAPLRRGSDGSGPGRRDDSGDAGGYGIARRSASYPSRLSFIMSVMDLANPVALRGASPSTINAISNSSSATCSALDDPACA